ncbi:hypothetical protein AGMMS50268_35080 [Spirochaetia bacterium]|nr:hypothetical protein AGMMS50268_35080 [Spirochaetia bacterium]
MMKRSLSIVSLFCLLFTYNLFAVEEVKKEQVPIDWDTNTFDMDGYIDSYLREYDYCSVDYRVKENPAEAIWIAQILTITYRNPDYKVVQEVHNYFIISYYFSNTLITNTPVEFFYSPYRTSGDMMQYVSRFNSTLEKIKLLISSKEVVSPERRNADIGYLNSVKKSL